MSARMNLAKAGRLDRSTRDGGASSSLSELISGIPSAKPASSVPSPDTAGSVPSADAAGAVLPAGLFSDVPSAGSSLRGVPSAASGPIRGVSSADVICGAPASVMGPIRGVPSDGTAGGGGRSEKPLPLGPASAPPLAGFPPARS